MNLRTTPLLFGLLLGILWLFGLMLVYKKGAVDENLILPTMAGADVKIDTVIIKYGDSKKEKENEELVFSQQNDLWYLLQNDMKVRVENFRIDNLIREIKDAKRYEEERTQDNLASYGLPPAATPPITVTLKGKRKDTDKEWKFYVGKGGGGDFTVYVNSSDRPGRAYPVLRSSIDALFFKDTADLRSKRLFDVVEPTVTSVLATDGKEALELKKVDNGWRFEKPADMGFAGFESTGDDMPKKDDPFKKDDLFKPKEKDAGGVKGLITAITALRVESEQDFEPIGAKKLADYGLNDGDETMRLALGSGSDKPEKKDAKKDEKEEKKDGNREVLLIGKKVPRTPGKKGEDQYYARMLVDQGVFRINKKMLDPIKDAVKDPKRIRSHDVVVYDPKKVDAVVVNITRASKDDKGKETTSKEEFKLVHPDDKDWQVAAAGDKTRKGGDKAILSFIEALEGKKEIKEFADGKDDNWGGLKGPATTEISVYLESLEKDKDKKKDDKKGDRKDEKKDEKKDDKDKDALPAFKKDAKPFVKLIIGTVDREQKIAHVKRVLGDGTESRFTVPLAYVEKLQLDHGPLAYVDSALPSQSVGEVAAIDIQRGKEKIELDHMLDSKFQSRWTLKDVHDPYGGKQADTSKVLDLAKKLTSLTAKKWVRKDDPDKLGLKDSQLVVTVYTKKDDRLTVPGAGGLIGNMATPRLLPTIGAVIANWQADRGDVVTLKFGKEIEENKEKLVYVAHSGTDLVAVVPADLVKQLRDADLRDRSPVAHTQALINGTLIATAGHPPINALLLASPLVSGVVHSFDPAKVKEVSVTLRTKVELRSFTFKRIGKEKTWEEVSGTKEFQLDVDKVTQLLDQVCKLKTDRFASFGGPTGDSKLTPKESMLRVELTFEDNSSVTLTIGAPFANLGYFAHSSYWPDAVFFVPTTLIDPWMHGASSFGKERAAAGL
jgi:hypothetical protein